MVSEASFEVGLAFGGVAERLLVPFDAIKSFFDPSVQFGLQFEQTSEDGASVPASPQSGEVSPPQGPAPQDRRTGADVRPRPPNRRPRRAR